MKYFIYGLVLQTYDMGSCVISANTLEEADLVLPETSLGEWCNIMILPGPFWNIWDSSPKLLHEDIHPS